VTSVRETVSGILGGAADYEAGLDALTVAPAETVDPALTAIVHEAVAALVRGGWQPAELHRVVARRGDPVQAHLVDDALAAYTGRFRTADPRWLAQIDDLGARVWWSEDGAYLREAVTRWRTDTPWPGPTAATRCGLPSSASPPSSASTPTSTPPSCSTRRCWCRATAP
jgi:hypothetical protein